ncbi:MAG: SUMF1/EgtB/PvdO family nonheme iron enzyme [Candidatus Thiosymbion ectosymbiont of Robbea hypermnestra]|nr:SUMF1/EgtB/PvdO family nonheme iron enzyme [Candidatus Thiosymbion ectosymbiont of Robbea hypermnestra]
MGRDWFVQVMGITLFGVLVSTSVLVGILEAAVKNRCADIDCTFNPKPAEDDFILPMPSGFQMVFRKVPIPGGAGFWGSRERVVRVGDIRGRGGDAAIFEGVQKLPVAGAFTEGEDWFYFLGKYEVSLGQYLAIMGDGDLQRGLSEFNRRSSNPQLIKDIKEAHQAGWGIRYNHLLAQPIRSLGWHDYQEAIRRYNLWCYRDETCHRRLPRLLQRLAPGSPPADRPGFFRLPTDLEWEYAARGGMQALGRKWSSGSGYEEALPFPVAEGKDYAWAKGRSKGKGPTRIGRLKPVHGFHDLIGNVQELTADLFRADLTQGKIGGRSARGGSFLDHAPDLRVSARAEVPPYQLSGGAMIEAKPPMVGIRLAIGSLVIGSEHYRDDLVKGYKKYQEATRKTTTAGRSLSNTFTRASTVDLERAREILASVIRNRPADIQLRNQLAKVQESLQSADRKINEGIFDVTDKLTSNALVILRTAGWHFVRYRKAKSLIDRIKKIKITDRTMELAEKRRIQHTHRVDFERNFERYAETVEKLQSYPSDLVVQAINRFEEQYGSDRPYAEACRLLRDHIRTPFDPHAWSKEIKLTMLKPGVF